MARGIFQAGVVQTRHRVNQRENLIWLGGAALLLRSAGTRRRYTMKSYEAFNIFCAALPATTYVVQWGGAHVWKVGGKVFAIGGWQNEELAFTFKTDPDMYEILRQLPGVRPAPYFAARGMKWIQHYAKPGLTHKQLKQRLRASHLLVSLGLTKKLQRELTFE